VTNELPEPRFSLLPTPSFLYKRHQRTEHRRCLEDRMKSIVIVMLAVIVAFAVEKPRFHFQGTVIDGLDRPVASVTVRVFNGHMGINDFEIDAETNVLTDAAGNFVG